MFPPTTTAAFDVREQRMWFDEFALLLATKDKTALAEMIAYAAISAPLLAVAVSVPFLIFHAWVRKAAD